MAKAVIEQENLRVYNTFVRLYEKASPIVRQISTLETFKYGELPISPYVLMESGITLRMMLNVVKKMPEPKDKELATIQREFEITLSSCIKAAEATEKYIELGGGMKGQVVLSTIINSTVLAHEYIESISKRLEAIKLKAENIRDLPEQKLHRSKEHGQKKTTENKDVQASPPHVIDKAAGGIEAVLDKIGDIIIFPIVKLVEGFEAAYRYFTGKRK